MQRAWGALLCVLVISCGDTGSLSQHEWVSQTAATATMPTFSVTAAGGNCETGAIYRFEVQNVTGEQLSNLVIAHGPFDLPGDRVRILCPTAEGVCQSEVFSAEFVPERCLFRLSPGDNFACRAALNFPSIQAALSGDTASGGRVVVQSSAESPVPAACENPPQLSLSLAASGGSCDTGPTWRVGIRNDSSQKVEQIRVLAQASDLPNGEVRILCPTGPGLCEFRDVPSDAVDAIARCEIQLSAGDGFACRAPLPVSNLSLSLSGTPVLGGSISATASASSDLLERCAAAPEVEFSATCGGDPTYRVAVRNTGIAKLTHLRIRAENRGTELLFCPRGNGVCDVEEVPVGTAANDGRMDCDFELSPGDDFACRAQVEASALNISLFGETFSGRPLFDSTEVTCAESGVSERAH